MGTVSAYNLNNIHACFGLGYNLNAYRGVTWWTDGGSTGTFGVTPIYMSEFLGKRPDNPDPYPYDSVHSLTFDGSGQAFPGTVFGHSITYVELGGGSNQVINLIYSDGNPHHGAMNFSVDGYWGMRAMGYIGSGIWRVDTGSTIVSTPGTYTFRFEATTNT